MSEATENKKEEVQTNSTEPAILQVKPQEELGELLQRLRNEPANQIRLVVPERSIIAQGSIVLRLLAEVAGKLKKEVSIVSDLPQIQRLAKRAGLKVEGVEAGDVEGHGFVPGTDVALEGATIVSSRDEFQSESSEDVPSMMVNDDFNQVQDLEIKASDPLERRKDTQFVRWPGSKQLMVSQKVGVSVPAVFLIVA